MATNWLNPTITSNYITFVDEMKARDNDAITLMGLGIPTTPPYAGINLVRSPVKFQEYRGSGTGFVDLVLSPAGGGTGVTSIPALVPQLGLGTMSTQNANAVNITAGSLNGVSITNSTLINTVMGGSARYSGLGFVFEYYQGYTPINIIGGPNVWSAFITGSTTAGQSLGLLVTAGTSKADNCIMTRNQDASKYGFLVRGDQGVFCTLGLVIPVGPNAYVPT